MKVCVTGGGGFLGSAICRQLASRGDRVIAYQRSAAPALEQEGIEVVRGDINDAGALDEALRDVDAVIHTAAKAGLSVNHEDFYSANVSGTECVLNACGKNAIRKLVFTSSPSVVHDEGDIEGGDESLPYPASYGSPYPQTKAESERMVLAANGVELRTVALRPHLIWGPGDNHLLPNLLKRASHGSLKLPGPDKLIDSVYVENAAQAHLLALDRLDTAPEMVGGRVYFISNDEPVTQGFIIAGLLEAAGVKVKIRPVSPKLAITAGALIEKTWKLFGVRSEPPLTRWSAVHLSTAHWFDISAAKRDLGYQPEVSIAEGLALLEGHFRSLQAQKTPPG
jgi:nucleoside-diphosphate-sugar epimerase